MGAFRDQKRGSYPLKLELYIAVNHLMWALGSEFRSSEKKQKFC